MGAILCFYNFYQLQPGEESKPDKCETVEQQQNTTREVKAEAAGNKGGWALTSNFCCFKKKSFNTKEFLEIETSK